MTVDAVARRPSCEAAGEGGMAHGILFTSANCKCTSEEHNGTDDSIHQRHHHEARPPQDHANMNNVVYGVIRVARAGRTVGKVR
mmetsp:Transcript_95732/g.194611  ORF Transcript_95732/g.194611 Transcript_95732/m.194611 type:complete len:84 (-) Transcript_95732:31-282(-)